MSSDLVCGLFIGALASFVATIIWVFWQLESGRVPLEMLNDYQRRTEWRNNTKKSKPTAGQKR